MRTRWRTLFGTSLVALVGILWLALRYDSIITSWLSVSTLGMIGSCGFALFAFVKDIPRRWPAAAVLICAAPMGQALLRDATMLPQLVVFGDIPVRFLVCGPIATIVISLYVLIVLRAPRPVDRIPPARAA